MKAQRRRLVRMVIGIIVAAALVAVGLLLFFPRERIAAMATERASRALGREVSFADVRLSLWGGLGVRLTGVHVGDPPGFEGPGLADVGAVDLKLKLLPLLHGEAAIDRLVIDHPVLRVRRSADGKSNVDFSPRKAAPAAGGGSREGAVPLVAIARCELRDGEVVAIDEGADTGLRLVGLRIDADLTAAEGDRLVSAGTASAETLLVAGPAPVPAVPVGLRWRLSADRAFSRIALESGALDFGPLTFTLTGDLTRAADGATAHATLASGRIAAAELVGLLPPDRKAALADVDIAGTLTVAAEASLAPGRPAGYAATIDLADLSLAGGPLPDELRVASATVTARPDTLRASVARATLGGQPLQGHLTVTHFAAPRLAGDLQGEIDLAYLKPFLPPDLEMTLGGRAAFTASAHGPLRDPERLEIRGRLDVTGGRVAAPRLPVPLTSLDASLALKPGTLTIERCEADFGEGSDASLTGTVTDPLAPLAGVSGRRPRLDFALRARRFDVDRVLPAASPAWVRGRGAGTAASPAGAAAPRDTLAGRFPDWPGDGTLQADTLVYGRVDFTHVAGKVRLRDRVLSVTDVTADAYTGKVAGTARVDLADLNRPVFGGDFAATAIEADDFLKRFTPLHDVVFGKFDLKGSYGASGRDGATVRRTLTLDAGARMGSGRLVTGGAVHAALAAIATKAGGTLAVDQPLRSLATHLVVRDGRVVLDTLATRVGDLGDLVFSGGYAFTGAVDGRGGLLLTPELSRKLLSPGGILGKLSGAGGGPDERLAVPLTVGGEMTAPQVKLDLAGALKTSAADAAQNAAQSAARRLRGLLGK